MKKYSLIMDDDFEGTELNTIVVQLSRQKSKTFIMN